MRVIDRWLQYFESAHIPHSHSVHQRAETALQTAVAEKMPAHEFARAIVYFGDTGFGIAVVPADQFVDLAKVAPARAELLSGLQASPNWQSYFPTVNWALCRRSVTPAKCPSSWTLE